MIILCTEINNVIVRIVDFNPLIMKNYEYIGKWVEYLVFNAISQKYEKPVISS